MKRILILAVMFLAIGTIALAQHSTTLTWVLSPTPGVVSQNVYRASCSVTPLNNACPSASQGAFTLLSAGTTISATATGFTDSTVTGGLAYVYVVTAVCPTGPGTCQGESVFSNAVAVLIPGGTPPQPPSGLHVSSVASIPMGTKTLVVAAWTDSNTPGRPVDYWITASNGGVISGPKNISPNHQGIYAISVTTKAKPTELHLTDVNNKSLVVAIP